MIKFKGKWSLLVLCVVALLGLPGQVRAADTNQPPVEKKTRKAPSVTPFHGKLKAADQVGKTISVGELVLQITSETKITRDGKPAVLADGLVGDKVAGAYRKTEDGKMDATTVKFGTDPEKEVKEPKEKKKKTDTAM